VQPRRRHRRRLSKPLTRPASLCPSLTLKLGGPVRQLRREDALRPAFRLSPRLLLPLPYIPAFDQALGDLELWEPADCVSTQPPILYVDQMVEGQEALIKVSQLLAMSHLSVC